jgi:4'-phosphopantetheinyl transferase
MELHWLEQTEADVPPQNIWLSATERAQLNGMRFAKRRTDWHLGRWTAKRGLAVYLNLPSHPEVLAKLELRPAASGAPEVFWAGEPAPVTVSLSHRDGRSFCAIAPAGVELGCDLEMIEPRSDAFMSDYFTADEQELVMRAPAADWARLLTLLWSAKESALKALHTGLRLDTRSVVVSFDESQFDLNGWSPLQVRCPAGRIFHGWWQQTDYLVRTVVADPSPGTPIRLTAPEDIPDRVVWCA